MHVVIAGGHGKIAMHLTKLLDERGDQVRSLIRNTDHTDEVRDAGATEAIPCDLETEADDRIAEAVGVADVVVFAAGAGPDSGPERKESMDHQGAVKLLEAADHNGIHRYVIVSSMGSDPDHGGEENFDVYLRAKGRADAAVASSDMEYAIVRPGMLTDDPATGKVKAGGSVGRGEISREDVAAVLAEVLARPGRRTFEVVGGKTPIAEALTSA